jgi:predicted ribosome quality control (RQC) complex YloA/Tae2 family protein
MLFRRKKDVDLRDLQRRGLIRIPKKEVELETDRNGFVDLRTTSFANSENTKDDLTSPAPEPGFFNFLDSASSTNSSSSTSSQVSDPERREFTRKIEELDNKIYKLEQRIELLERM